jgi:transcriptional regulator with XRE-family HTH domain
MGAYDRPFDRGTRQGERWLTTLGQEFRSARLSLGLSQARVAEAGHTSRQTYGRIELAKHRHVTVLRAAQFAAVLGLELSARTYPGGSSTRDHAHAERLHRLLQHVGAPLRYRTEAPLPATTDHPERRSWDAMIFGHGQRTAVEMEMRLYDGQAQLRRLNLKRRDDPPDHFLLVLADTRPNRRVLTESPDLFADLPRLRTATILASLRAGRHPPTGMILL